MMVTTTCGAPPTKVKNIAELKRRDQRIAEEGAVGEQTAGSGKEMREAFAGRDFPRLGQLKRRPDQDRRGEQPDEGEDRVPAERGVERAADQRRDHRGDDHRHRDPADHRGGAIAIVEVANDRAADHDADGRAKRLACARHDQARDRGGGERREARDDGQHEAGEHHGAAAEAVGERAEHELRDRHAEQEQRERELYGARARAERADQSGHCGGEDVQRERADRRDGDQQREQPPLMPAIGAHGSVLRVLLRILLRAAAIRHGAALWRLRARGASRRRPGGQAFARRARDRRQAMRSRRMSSARARSAGGRSARASTSRTR